MRLSDTDTFRGCGFLPVVRQNLYSDGTTTNGILDRTRALSTAALA